MKTSHPRRVSWLVAALLVRMQSRTGPKRGPSLKRGNEPDQDQDQDQGLPGHQDQDQDQEPDQLPSQPLFAAATAFRRSSLCTWMPARFSKDTISAV